MVTMLFWAYPIIIYILKINDGIPSSSSKLKTVFLSDVLVIFFFKSVDPIIFSSLVSDCFFCWFREYLHGKILFLINIIRFNGFLCISFI